ncbi:hypothetical protein [Plantactinospora sp. KLBMP9567]|uniref:hypothetical protein n=1 Tax=Plantactinospora sp. KLBMP9567 TaxID=3085900 RepID=UPI0029827944|nr:hypothetical protein [Plantactinospora sp. KLBMP9567]MDW5322294.1 hypothetical protein [Plantactinospora sp. KLBMP9567]
MRLRPRLLVPVLVTGALLPLTVAASVQATEGCEAPASRLVEKGTITVVAQDPDDPTDDWPWDNAG